MSNRVITINRMFGSNGRIIGKALAEELGFKFYDKELIEMASREKNIPFDEFARVDEKSQPVAVSGGLRAADESGIPFCSHE